MLVKNKANIKSTKISGLPLQCLPGFEEMQYNCNSPEVFIFLVLMSRSHGLLS